MVGRQMCFMNKALYATDKAFFFSVATTLEKAKRIGKFALVAKMYKLLKN